MKYLDAYRHKNWAIENGIADCYDEVDQKYNEKFHGHVNITCVYRCPVKNTAVDSPTTTSKHLEGKAFDFDQLSSIENWRVGKAANDCNNNYQILLYYRNEDGKKVSKKFSDLPGETEEPWETFTFLYGHIGIQPESNSTYLLSFIYKGNIMTKQKSINFNKNCCCFLIACIISYLFIIEACYGIFLEDNKVDWKRYYNLVIENKLPMLSSEEENEIIKETDRILNETKSIYSAQLYLISKLGDKKYEGYLLFGNPRIKEKLVNLLKMSVHCSLKEYFTSPLPTMNDRKDLDEESKRRVLKWHKEQRQIAKRVFEYLISKDRDLCPECFLFDRKEDEELTPPPGQEREFEPEGFYANKEMFYSITFCTFSKEIYDYLWLKGIEGIKGDTAIKSQFVNFAMAFPEKFIDDISLGNDNGTFIYRQKGGGILFDNMFEVVQMMIDMNHEFVEKEKNRIKEILSKYIFLRIENYNSRREKIIKTLPEEKSKKESEQEYTHLVLSSSYTNGIRTRETMLKIYEQIGEKEDIENIKKLAENIPLDYPVWETYKEYDEKSKNEYLQRMKKFQERVNTLIEKLSM